MSKHHYTYLLTAQVNDTQIHYAGVRSSVCDPIQDTTYYSSSKLVHELILSGVQFDKKIIEQHATRQIAEQEEQNIFDMFDAVNDYNWINLNSLKDPYRPGLAAEKMRYFKKLFPQIDARFFVDKYRAITRNDAQFMIYSYNQIWVFANHPDRLKYYYPTTGTKTFHPGREDRLMTQKLTHKEYYLTEINLSGLDPAESIEYLWDHYIKGQRVPILEMIGENMKLLPEEQWHSHMDIIQSRIDVTKYDWVINRIVKDRKGTKKKKKNVDLQAQHY